MIMAEKETAVKAFLSHCIPSSLAKDSEINYFMQ